MLRRLAVVLSLGAAAPPALAISVLPLDLNEVIDTAAVAFEGRCVANVTERDPATGFVVTHTTFEVRDALKGSVTSSHVIKQVGGSLPDESLHFRVEGVPKFTVGEDYVVFLAGVSKSGFSSPVGLAQGRFGIKQGASGREVGNGRDFKELTARIPQSDLPAASRARMQQPGRIRHLDLDDFKRIVRERVGGK